MGFKTIFNIATLTAATCALQLGETIIRTYETVPTAMFGTVGASGSGRT